MQHQKPLSNEDVVSIKVKMWLVATVLKKAVIAWFSAILQVNFIT